MTRKRKLFLGAKPIGGPSLKSRRIARRVTSEYHNIRQASSLIEKRTDLSEQEKQQELQKLQDQLKEMGGINRYQEASVISTQHFQTSKWIIQALRRLKRLPERKRRSKTDQSPEDDDDEQEDAPSDTHGDDRGTQGQRLKTLEVGAINDQLCTSPLLAVRAIDVNARLPCIEELDFFELLPTQSYEVVVCSMVINCVFDPIKRAEMIGRLNMQLTDNGVLFLILPKRCLQNSNMNGSEQFVKLLKVLGLKLLEEPHFTPRLAFFVLQRNDETFEKVKKAVQVGKLGDSDSNDPHSGEWAKAVKLMIKDSQDEETKQFFSKEKLNLDEFCLRIDPKWLNNTKQKAKKK